MFETLIEPHFDLIGMFVVCFDLTNKQSFEHVRKWEKKLRALGVNVKGITRNILNPVNDVIFICPMRRNLTRLS